MKGATVQNSCRVLLRYTLSFPDGRFIEGTKNGEPAAVTIGSGDLAAFLEGCLVGMSAGEQHHFEISGLDTLRFVERDVVQCLAISDFPPELMLAPGVVIEFQTPDGDQVPGVVTALNETEVTVDFSQPLIGRDLVFEVEILSIECP